MPDSTNPTFPRAAVPVFLDLVSIGQSMNYHPRRTCLILSIPLSPVVLGPVSIGQSVNYRHRRTCLILSTPLRPALMGNVSIGQYRYTRGQYLLNGIFPDLAIAQSSRNLSRDCALSSEKIYSGS